MKRRARALKAIDLGKELERLEKSGRKGTKGLEGVIVATSPQTGEVTAVVGGRVAYFDGFNRALDARRPIGSLAKPMVYLAALETAEYSPVSFLADVPVELKLPVTRTPRFNPLPVALLVPVICTAPLTVEIWVEGLRSTPK